MAITNPQRVITVERLNQFLSGLFEIFLTEGVANNNYAYKSGDSNTPFSVGNLNIHGDVSVSFHDAAGNNPAMLVIQYGDENGQVNIPLVDGVMATTEQLNAVRDLLANKADLKVITANNVTRKFCVQSHPNVFNGVIDSSADSTVFSSSYQPYVGHVYYFGEVSHSSSIGVTTPGFYLVTGITPPTGSSLVSYNQISEVKFICAASVYAIYYNIYKRKFYRFTERTGFSEIEVSSSGTTPVDPPSDYEEATSEDIAGIIDNYINNTQTE